jgi:peptidoglycan-associated lipoprotein
MKHKLIILILMFSVKSFYGQKDFKSAEKLFGLELYNGALELYKKALPQAKPDQQPIIMFKTAECYRMIGDYSEAEQWYTKTIKAGYTDPVARFYLAEALKSEGKFEEALAEYTTYKTDAPSDPRAQDGFKSCELAQKWTQNPTSFKLENVAFNTKEDDFAPAYADRKYNKLNFASTRQGISKSQTDDGKNNSDLFESQLEKGKWSAPVVMPEPVSTKYNEASCAVSRKGELLFFTRFIDNESKNSQLWYADRKGPVWADPVKLEFCAEGLKYASPSISDDGTMLLFSSNMPGGQGDNDLWMSVYDKGTKKWGAPTNLGPDINTAGNDDYPFLDDDGTLYFSSNGRLGMGGLDIFKAEKTGDGQWANVTNMKYPINSGGDDFGIIFETSKKGYLSSKREGTKGGVDIWSFVDAPLLITIEGTVSDCNSKEAIEGVFVKLVGSDGSSAEAKTDASGNYKFTENSLGGRCVNPNTSYIISINNKQGLKTTKYPEGFFKHESPSKQSTVGVNENKNFTHDFCLSPKPFETVPLINPETK